MTQGTPDMSKEPSQREQAPEVLVSNQDRERVHAFLSAAMSAGVLTPEEYTDRAGRAVVARTTTDLDALTRDLPLAQLSGAANAATAQTTQVSQSGRSAVRRAVAVLSGAEIGGGAVVADTLRAVAFMGGVEIDLRDVEFTSPTVEITCTAVMGGVQIVVPEDVNLEVHGFGLMGGFSGRASGPGTPGAPHVVVKGFAFMGGVDVTRRARDAGDGRKLPR